MFGWARIMVHVVSINQVGPSVVGQSHTHKSNVVVVRVCEVNRTWIGKDNRVNRATSIQAS